MLQVLSKPPVRMALLAVMAAAIVAAGLFAPHIDLLVGQSLAIKLHLATALASLMVGAILLTGVKGTTLHRTLGWIWATCMMTVAVSSLLIRELNPPAMSLIHLLSGWTILILPVAVYAARRHNVKTHSRSMIGLFIGGLLIAGLFTFLPGRLLWRIFAG